MQSLNTPIEHLTKIHPKIVPMLKRLGIHALKDLLYHFPARYDDFSLIKLLTIEIHPTAFDITVAIAAPLTPISNKNIKIGSSTILTAVAININVIGVLVSPSPLNMLFTIIKTIIKTTPKKITPK